MTPRSLLIDTNLLLLFVVGTASREFIPRHKRLKQFTIDDFDLLVDVVSRAQSVLVSPNILTETSNLAAYIAEPARTRIFEKLRQVIAVNTEAYVPSKVAARREEFVRLGLTDATLIEAASTEIAVLTTDLDLYLAVKAQGASAVNFNHLRDSQL